MATAGRCALSRIDAFDPSGFACQIAGQIRDFSVREFVPKSYRKATKVMARDIELAVAAADLAARDAKIVTKGTDGEATPTYAPGRVGCHIGAGLIAADIDELTGALVEARREDGSFDIHKWGREGMTHLTPLWLLKYLPNMPACHVTIIHDAQGPSNTITCNEASGILSIGESLRVIQRGQADLCFCGGADSKLNPMAYLRQQFAGKLTSQGNDDPGSAVKPFDLNASGGVVGEGGGIVILESHETFAQRQAANPQARAYAEVLGFGASQTVNPATRNAAPDVEGRGIAGAMRSALREAGVDSVDGIIAFGLGSPDYDGAEANALRSVFGDALARIPVACLRALVGNCGAGGSALDVCVAALAVANQALPMIVNRAHPRPGLGATKPAGPLQRVLVYATGLGGQNAAMVLGRAEV
jgi:3-oxoacyl-[acyl-carrier-protein] synthase II